MNDREVREQCLRLLRDGVSESPAPGAAADPVDAAAPAAAAFTGGDALLSHDIDGDIAVVSLLRHGSDRFRPDDVMIEGLTFQFRGGEWMELGGGAGSAPERPLDRRSEDELGGPLRVYASGRTVRNADRLLPWGAKWVNQARLRAAAGVASIRVGSRVLGVPEHGHVAIVWGSRRAPRLEALDADGGVRGVLDLEHPTVAAPA
ncbi:hypothetical protein [Actinomadura harenae]|uniref:Uncharacterized protein n=1 Tax=Actinomadura harenae TaxID=2483351 RepID=A0A3M2MGI0_9ACTN|nr:hypothetical protein [Actinomadura harenae]RMI46348.1 hypothetical protein EBO15_07220 [Actinomadura harenae]